MQDFENIKHFDNFANYTADSEIQLTKIEFLHNENAIYCVEISYKVGSHGETSYLEHKMMGDSPINKTKLSKSAVSLLGTERIVSCSGVFGRQMYSLLFTTNYSKTHQVNDFHKFYDQSFETRYDFELDEGVAFINAGFLSSLYLLRIIRGDGISQNLPSQPFRELTLLNKCLTQFSGN